MTNNNNATPLRAILYSRVSSEKQADNTSHETQYEAGLKWAQGHNAVVVRYYKETESGALYLSRGVLQKALADLEANEADVLVIYDFSRYSREREAQEVIRKRVERAGKRLAFTTLSFDYDEDSGEMTPESQLLFGTLGSAAAYELAQIKRRLVGGQRKKVAEGRQVSGTDPFGLHVLKKADAIRGECTKEQVGTYVVVSEQAALVRIIFQWYDEGYPLNKIARVLNMQGQRTTRGKLWRPDGVRDILMNPAYKGQATYGRTRRVVDESRLARGFKTKTFQVEREGKDIKTIPCPVIVEPELWERANARLKTARARHGGRKDRVFMLSGLLRCPLCGGALRGQAMKPSSEAAPRKRTKHYRYYKCANLKNAGSTRASRLFCTQPMIAADDIEQAVITELLALLADEKLLRAALKKQQETGRDKSKPDVQSLLQSAQKQLADLGIRENATIQAQIRAVGSGVDSAPYEKILVEIGAQKRELQGFIDSQAQQEKRLSNVPRQAAQLHDQLELIQLNLTSPHLSAAEKHDLLTMIIERIELGKNNAPRLIFLQS